MAALADFRQALEHACNIVTWSPTDQELRRIAQLLVRQQPHSRGEAYGLVARICPSALVIATEGLDNSDLRTLLALALAAATTTGT